MSGMRNTCVKYRNYRIINGIAYTEDNVEICKLTVYEIPEEASQQELLKYFKRFGKVIRVQMFDSKHFGTKIAYVYFATPRGARKALASSFILYGNPIGIRPSDSWLQPNAYQPCYTRKRKFPNADLNPSEPLIFKLNQHCVHLILELLPLGDQVCFARTCVHFNDMYELCSPSLHKVIEVEEFNYATVWEMLDFFTKSGCNVKEMIGKIPLKHRYRFMKYFRKHCKNLQILHLYNSVFYRIDMYKIFRNLPNLVDVKLINCNLIYFDFLALKHLKHLDLSENLELSGENMQLPESIETLTLFSCLNINPSKITTFLQRLPLLKSLNLLMVKSLKTQGFKEMVSYCQALEELHISVCKSEAYETLAQLPSLTNLIIHEYYNEQLRHDLFAELIQHKSTQLKHLEILSSEAISSKTLLQLNQLGALQTLKIPPSATFSEKDMQSLCKLSRLQYLDVSHCDNVTNNLVVRLLISCQNLNHLCLNYCAKLDGALVFEIIEKIKLQSNKIYPRKLPIEMYVADTLISHHILADPRYKNAANIIIVPFGYSTIFYKADLSFHMNVDDVNDVGDVDDVDDVNDVEDVDDVGDVEDVDDSDDVIDSPFLGFDADDFIVNEDSFDADVLCDSDSDLLVDA